MATATQQATLPPNLDCEGAAEFLGTTAGTLNVWRCTRRVQIPYFRLGRKIMYRRSDLENYIAQHIVVGEVAE
jgi:hypothetical protein